MKVKSESEATQSCPTLSDSMDCLPGSSVHGIFQARVLEWGAIAFSEWILYEGLNILMESKMDLGKYKFIEKVSIKFKKIHSCFYIIFPTGNQRTCTIRKILLLYMKNQKWNEVS